MMRHSTLAENNSGSADLRDAGDLTLRVMDNIPAMIAYWDAEGKCRFANEAYSAWFSKTREEVIGMSSEDLFGAQYASKQSYITEVLKGNPQVFEGSGTLADGRVSHMLTTYTPDIVGDKVAGYYVHVADLTGIKELESELKVAKEQSGKLALYDFLTRLPNRTLFDERLSQALALAERSKQLVAVMLIDMNGFKAVNDVFGRAEGDRLLSITADRLLATLRTCDTLARIGGDEFAVLCVDIESSRVASVLANRLRASVCKRLVCNGVTFTPSLSIGVALYPKQCLTQEELMHKAEMAMHEARKRGENCVAFCSAAPDKPEEG
jgi:diguanylate cyclase (GGDEF)-like protein/PAS domain S-box-containing protein